MPFFGHWHGAKALAFVMVGGVAGDAASCS